MNPTRPIDSPPSVQGMRGGFAFSVGVHVLILVLMIFGLPFFHSKPRDLPPMISVELVQMGKETTTNKVSTANKVVKQPEEEKPAPPTPPPPESTPTPPQPTPHPPEPQPRPTMEAAPKLSSVDTAVSELKMPDVVIKAPIPNAPKLADIQPKVDELTPPAKVDFKKAPPKPPAESFDSVLKNLTKQTPQKPTDQPPTPQAKSPPRPASGAQAPVSANLTASEMDALSQQLRQCWSLPATAKDAQDLVVDVDITVNPDRTISSAPRVVDQGRMASDPAYRAAAMAAVRAFRMPQCSPLALPPDKYQEWQSMTVHFDPKEMLGQ
jgi:outer membrane biosynthesis protein TonB